jgi:hypothetical protein
MSSFTKLGFCGLLAIGIAHGWGPMHATMTRAAMDTLPAWQQQLLVGQRDLLIEKYCIIPDLAQAPEYRAEFGKFLLLPNGDRFTHEPHERAHNAFLMLHYFATAVEQFKAGGWDEGARYAGSLVHFLEDSGSPAHSMPGDNQLSLFKDFLAVPDAFRNRLFHGLVESGDQKMDISGYRPQLLGTTSEEAVFNLVERLNFLVRNARGQVIPILNGIFEKSQPAIDAARRRAAVVDAQVVADMLYTAISIARNRFDPKETAPLATRDASSLTPLEMIRQSYFPQFSYFSDPYFGYPMSGGIMDGDEKRALKIVLLEDGQTRERTFQRGLGLGTTSRLTYALPNKVYDGFECWVGLHSSLGKEGNVVFRVFVDGEAVFYSGPMAGQDPARKVKLPIWNAREISVVVESRNTQRGKNYAVIAEPTLIKAVRPPQSGVY